MSSLRGLYRLLAPLGLYALGQNSLVDRELEAYGQGFALLEAALPRLTEDIHPQTAQGEALSLWERGVGLPHRGGAPPEERRALVLARLSRPPFPNKAGVLEWMARCGFLEPRLEEGAGILYLGARAVAPGLGAGEAWALLLAALPAHLEVQPHPEGKRWTELDARSRSWMVWDGAARSWDELEILTQ